MAVIGKPFNAQPYSEGSATPPANESVADVRSTRQVSEASRTSRVPPTAPTASKNSRMVYAAQNFGFEELEATLTAAPQLLQFNDLDRAMQVAMDTVVRVITDGHADLIRRYCGSTVITGYIVGRTMLGTVNGALHYSNPLTEADNVEQLVKLTTTSEGLSLTDDIGPMGQVFMDYQIEMAGRVGPLSALPADERKDLAGGSAVLGMVLAIAEHDLFAA